MLLASLLLPLMFAPPEVGEGLEAAQAIFDEACTLCHDASDDKINLDYYCCRSCRRIYDGKNVLADIRTLTLLLHTSWQKEQAKKGDTLFINWAKRGVLCDFDRAEILEADETDVDGNVILRRNIGVRDVPSPAINPLCGSVITIVVDGVLSVPFLDEVTDAPSYDRDDVATQATIGGRYEFRVAVQ